MYGIGSYVLGDTAGRQVATGAGYDEGPRVSSGGGGASGAVATVGSIFSQLFPGGVPATVAAVRGGATGPAGTVAPVGGGTDWMSMLMPIALIAGAVGIGYVIIKKLRKRAA